jgi:hypothetical protein
VLCCCRSNARLPQGVEGGWQGLHRCERIPGIRQQTCTQLEEPQDREGLAKGLQRAGMDWGPPKAATCLHASKWSLASRPQLAYCAKLLDCLHHRFIQHCPASALCGDASPALAVVMLRCSSAIRGAVVHAPGACTQTEGWRALLSMAAALRSEHTLRRGSRAAKLMRAGSA